ncbi:50S ribosomal protein L5 [Endomicrobium proavitum]|uniref:Large ribosomal subunit protein uL5 n=1 Tax=Endomicrobium proavitum TaxID=1408281 RepID=A0A0G3WMH0_9BACT|nr:50S ribosomal protein L5 [Endomicrobium proavitum]AKL98684.1 50S ribosomal subunit protein L5 [Endomicrobium proavitum]
MNQPRLKEFYQKNVSKDLMSKFKFKNVHQIPKLEKIVINIGLTEAKENIKVLDTAVAELAAITGQKPLVTRAKKSISNFKLREGMPIGAKVTLRNFIMFEFLDRLINVAIPRIRDFRGIEPRGFDGQGNFNLGLTEQYIFPEINVEKSDKPRGMNITIVTNAKKDEHAKALLEALGVPFRKRETK